jgi:hypothetical protein
MKMNQNWRMKRNGVQANTVPAIEVGEATIPYILKAINIAAWSLIEATRYRYTRYLMSREIKLSGPSIALLAHGQPFARPKTGVSNNSHDKKKDTLKGLIRIFLVSLTLLPSCFNRPKSRFIKCGCINKLQDQDHGRVIAYITALYTELINGQHHCSYGYNLRSGSDKSN